MIVRPSLPTITGNRLLQVILLAVGLTTITPAQAQTVLPYVDHWDSLKTVKKSEGLMVNGREWGEWKFWDTQGRLTEKSDFKSGERDGHQGF